MKKLVFTAIFIASFYPKLFAQSSENINLKCEQIIKMESTILSKIKSDNAVLISSIDTLTNLSKSIRALINLNGNIFSKSIEANKNQTLTKKLVSEITDAVNLNVSITLRITKLSMILDKSFYTAKDLTEELKKLMELVQNISNSKEKISENTRRKMTENLIILRENFDKNDVLYNFALAWKSELLHDVQSLSDQDTNLLQIIGNLLK